MTKQMLSQRKLIPQNGQIKTLFIGATAGTLIGATSALLLAPKSGKELREDIYDTYQGIKEQTQEIAHNIADGSKQAMSTVSDLAENVKESATSLMGSERTTSNFNIILAAVGGGLLGVTAAMLLAPKEEEEIATNLEQRAKKVVATSVNWINTAKDVIETLHQQLNVAEEHVEESDTLQRPMREALRWAALGLNFWKNMQRGK